MPIQMKRIPQDREEAQMIAQAIWDHRHSAEVKTVEGEGSSYAMTHVVFTPSFSIHLSHSHNQATVKSGGHSRRMGVDSAWSDLGSTIYDAWSAAQCARMLRTMGLSDEIPGDAVDLGRIPFRMLRGLCFYSGMPTQRMLENRLDAAAADVIARFNPDEDAKAIALADGLIPLRSYGRGVLEHPQHGITTCTNARFPLTAEAFRTLRDRSLINAISAKPALPAPTMPALGNARASRMMQLCAVAVQHNPMLTDASGTRLAPLVETHVPELVRIHREASLHALPQELERIDDDFSEAMEIVCDAVEEGLAAMRGKTQDDLRTQIAFLRSRHPRQTALTPIEDDRRRTIAA
jgi:hypothetical protein